MKGFIISGKARPVLQRRAGTSALRLERCVLIFALGCALKKDVRRFST